jgi:hypothetical protein
MAELQVCKPDFFLKMTPMFDAGDNVGMVSVDPRFQSSTQTHTCSAAHAPP